MDQARLIEILEIFSARICHDLVGPVGAISNGVELLSEGGMSGDPEVIALIADSARGASRRLQFFRSAFGAGNTVSGGQPIEGARALAMDYFADGRVRIAWPVPGSALETPCGSSSTFCSSRRIVCRVAAPYPSKRFPRRMADLRSRSAPRVRRRGSSTSSARS
jgi:hypothetical protein